MITARYCYQELLKTLCGIFELDYEAITETTKQKFEYAIREYSWKSQLPSCLLLGSINEVMDYARDSDHEFELTELQAIECLEIMEEECPQKSRENIIGEFIANLQADRGDRLLDEEKDGQYPSKESLKQMKAHLSQEIPWGGDWPPAK